VSGNSGKARVARRPTDGRYSRRRVIVAATAVLGWQLLNARLNATRSQENKMGNNTDTVRSMIYPKILERPQSVAAPRGARIEERTEEPYTIWSRFRIGDGRGGLMSWW
jgi:hypothetical protein